MLPQERAHISPRYINYNPLVAISVAFLTIEPIFLAIDMQFASNCTLHLS